MWKAEQLTLVGFLAGYRGYTRDAYALDLRLFNALLGELVSRGVDLVHRHGAGVEGPRARRSGGGRVCTADTGPL